MAPISNGVTVGQSPTATSRALTLDAWRADVHTAWRGLWRAPAFTATAVLILATGIASAALMLAVTHGVLLRPLPVRDADRLVVAWKTLPGEADAHHPFGVQEIEAVANATSSFEAVAGVDANGIGREVLQEGGQASLVATSLVTGRYFDVLGVTPVLGRALRPADDEEGAEPVVVISHGHWQRRHGASNDILGQRVTLGDQRFTIVGVMPPDLDFPTGVEIWRTTRSVPTTGPFGDAARREVDLVGRLRGGVSLAQVNQELAALTRRLEETAAPGATRGLVPVTRTFTQAVVGDVKPLLLALLAAVGLVLVIATANVANLLVLRAEQRSGELAVREVLGAARGRIVRLLLVEGLLLGVSGAIVGLVTARGALPVVLRLLPDGLPRVGMVRLDLPVVVAVSVLSVLAAMVAAALPLSWQGSMALRQRLRRSERSATGGTTRHVRRTLVAAQVALAVIVVAAAGLLTRGVLHLQHVPTGLVTERLVYVGLGVPPMQLSDRVGHAQRLERLVQRLEAHAPIVSVTPVHHVPFAGEAGWDVPRFTAEGQSDADARTNPWLNLESVHANYFETLGVTVTRGRAFAPADRDGSPLAVIVSEDVASRTWPGADPIGKRVKMGGPESRDDWRTVVGVVRLTRYRDLVTARPTIYLPAAQFIDAAQGLVLRSAAPLDEVSSMVRTEVAALGSAVSVVRVSSFGALLDRPLARPRFTALVLSAFAGAALLLATVGLYAVTAASVRHRRGEIAIRVAVGAQPADVRRLVLGETLRVAGLGSLVGLAGAAATTQLVARVALFPVTGGSATAVGAVLVLMAAAALASSWPIREATRVDAAAALRD